ncbi:MAG: DUF1838 family protein [Lysobacterales bacterium]
MSFSRRQFIATVGIAGAITLANGKTLPTDDASRYVRLRSASAGKPAMWVYAGVMLVKPEGQVAKPIVGMAGVTFTRALQRSPGVYDWQLDEVGYYLDLETGAVVNSMINPFNKTVVEPPHYRAPENLTFMGSKVMSRASLPPEMDFNGQITRLADLAGLSAMTEDMYLNMPAQQATDEKPARPARQLASLKTYTARSADLDRPGDHWIDCQFSYCTMNTFASWLDMSDVSGVQNMRLAGTKCRLSDTEAIPGWFAERVASDHPDFLKLPLSWK